MGASSAPYDGVIIGGGHNGLTCAAYLARAGARVAVIEKEETLGGGTRTEELTQPGFRHNSCANFFIGFDASPVPSELELDQHGFEFLRPRVQQAFLARDESALVLYTDVDASAGSLATLSPADAGTFTDLCDRYEALRPFFVAALYSPPAAVAALRETLSDAQRDELAGFARTLPYDIVEGHFSNEHLRCLMKKLFHVVQGTNSIGMGPLFPVLFLNLRRMCMPVGGSQSFVDALASVVRANGGTVLTGAGAERILVENGRVRGVALDGGDEIEVRDFVASGVDFPQTVGMVTGRQLDGEVVEKADGWDWTGAFSLVTLHLALDAPPAYRAAEHRPDINSAFNITFGVDTSEELIRSFDDLRAGRFPSLPAGNGSCNTLFDESYAPPGKHSAFWWPFAGYHVDGDAQNWETRRKEYADRLLDCWRQYATGLDDSVVDMALRTPLDVERDNASMRLGSVRMGPYLAQQFGPTRPHPSWADYRVPDVQGLYHCASTSPNGGGVNGSPGYSAAGVIAGDLGYDRWWPEMTVERARELC